MLLLKGKCGIFRQVLIFIALLGEIYRAQKTIQSAYETA